ncbi:PAS domain-containing sensor histidine kinase [Chitinophaga sp. CF418]|uniref:PAS domain-containing sensor histidine kinase n=1 Tax=Chitinophaga sp. CF418 TaxID=1855287 RepID=UPI0009172EB1|nr:PAS domain-containing sensor histidine kinase [Chitinophaga sp. CF418]SHN32007.1 PAS domain S-box-containing protein [Chitinophaga sp. CF418]
MNVILEALLNKHFAGSDLPLPPDLLHELDVLLNDTTTMQQEIGKSNEETGTLEELYHILWETLNLLGAETSPVIGDGETMRSIVNATDLLNAECRNIVFNEQKTLRETVHLKTIQRVAKAGSWDVPATRDLSAVQNYWSAELFHLLGIDPSETKITYEQYIGLVHPDDRGFMLEEVNRAYMETGRYDTEYRIIPGGDLNNPRIVREIAEVIKDEHTGEPVSLIGVTMDITEIKLAERAIVDANTELRTLFNTMNEVFFSVNVDQDKLLQISPACTRLYGYAPEMFTKDPFLWFTVIVDEDKKKMHESNLLLSQGENSQVEYRIRHKNGQIKWLLTRMRPTLNVAGKLIRIDGISADVTERKEAELALANSELKLRTLLENSNDAIVIINEHLDYTFATESIGRIIGYATEEFVGTSMLNYIHEEDRGFIAHSLLSLNTKPEEPLPFEVRFRAKDGHWVWLEGVATNHSKEEVIKGYIVNFRDVTEEIRYRRELEDANDKLKKTNTELDRFVYSVSHDLRAPLASILGLIEFTASETDDGDIKQNLSMMEESIKKLDVFILDILDYSRNARLEVKRTPIDFSGLLIDIRNSLKFISTGNSNVEIRINIDEDGTFCSDRSRISIILNNLISNAVRYCDPAKPAPYVEVTVVARAGGALIGVKDNGIGIHKDYHQYIFNMFYRISEKSKGSGLGLYLVKETIEKLNGDIQLTSMPGVGTEFKIYLPNP